VSSFAQDPTSPKKNSFDGFGSSLDQRPKGYRMASPPPGPSSLPSRAALSVSTGLTFEAKTVANGGGITAPGAVASQPQTAYGVPKQYAPPSKIETRASHPVLQLKVHNLAPQPANAHFDYFFIASGLNGGGRYVWDHGERDVAVRAGGDQTETIESIPVEQRTINETHSFNVTTTYTNGSTSTQRQTESTQRRTGSRPDGWIVRMFVGNALVKVQASTSVFEQVARDPVALEQLLKSKPPQ
jgi:hypothetical protein